MPTGFTGSWRLPRSVKQAALAWVPEAMRFRALGDAGEEAEEGEAEPEDGEAEAPNGALEPEAADAADEVRETVDA